MPDRFKRHVKIELTSAQRARIRRLTGMEYPFVEMPLVELAALTMVAAAAGSEALPVTPLAIRQMSEPGQGSDPSTIEVELIPEQKERIRRATGRNISSLRMVPDDFVPAYRESWDDTGPIRVGRTLVIKSAKTTLDAARTDRVIELPDGEGSTQSVFGTGRHPATQLSLIMLEKYIGPGDQVLDLGTGSGILAVAAAKLGATEVQALDIDAAAVATAQETVECNGLADVVKVAQGGIEAATPPYDLVVANIFPGVTIRLAPDLAVSVRHRGVFISSGLVAARAEDVTEAIRSRGFRLMEQRAQDGWVAMAFARL